MSFKVWALSMLDTAVSLAQQLNPLWLLPEWLQNFILTGIKGVVTILTVVALVLYRNQNGMLYHPEIPGVGRDPAENPRGYRSPSEYNMPYENVTVETEDNLKLHCWFVRQADAVNAPTLIFFQENAGNMGLRLPSMHQFYEKLGMNIFMVSYRGYGRSEGTPTEEGLQKDAQAVLNHVWNRKDLDKKRLLVLGRSLGGAVSVYITNKNPEKVKGLILENTFTSIPDMVDVVMPWVAPFKGLVLRIGWKSVEKISSITTPILFISGRDDELVPPHHMDGLYQAATSSIYKAKHEVPNGRHNDTWQKDTATYNNAVKEFMLKIGAVGPF